MSLEKVNGESYFVQESSFVFTFAIWWACGNRWCIGDSALKGSCNCLAYYLTDSKCLSDLDDSKWIIYNGTDGWKPAENIVLLRAVKSKRTLIVIMFFFSVYIIRYQKL